MASLAGHRGDTLWVGIDQGMSRGGPPLATTRDKLKHGPTDLESHDL
jgi:hypothetical protein